MIVAAAGRHRLGVVTVIRSLPVGDDYPYPGHRLLIADPPFGWLWGQVASQRHGGDGGWRGCVRLVSVRCRRRRGSERHVVRVNPPAANPELT